MYCKFSKLLVFFPLVLLLENCSAKPSSPDTPVPVVERGKYRIGSFNIRYYNDTDGEFVWPNRYPAVKKFFADEAPDIIGLQEVRNKQVSDIRAIDGYDSYMVFRNSGTEVSSNDEDEGNGIMWDKSRFTLVDKGFFWLCPTPEIKPVWKNGSYPWGTGCRRIAVYVKLLDKKQYNMPVYFYATHFDNNSETARLESAKLVLDRMRLYLCTEDLSSFGDRVFLVGDLNCDVKEEAIKVLSNQLNSAREKSPVTSMAGTFNDFGGKYNGGILDHIFYCGPGKPASFRVISKDYGIKYISDHYPVVFDAK